MNACTRGITLKITTGKRKPKYSEKGMSRGCSAHQIPHGVLWLNPGVLGEQPATDCVSYG